MPLPTWLEQQPRIGQTVALELQGFAVFCTIIDAKSAYGQLRYKLTPRSGIGTTWVNADRVRLIDQGVA